MYVNGEPPSCGLQIITSQRKISRIEIKFVMKGIKEPNNFITFIWMNPGKLSVILSAHNEMKGQCCMYEDWTIGNSVIVLKIHDDIIWVYHLQVYFKSFLFCYNV